MGNWSLSHFVWTKVMKGKGTDVHVFFEHQNIYAHQRNILCMNIYDFDIESHGKIFL